MRWDSPFVLAVAGTLALHLTLVTVGDALVVTHPPHPHVPAPRIDLIDVEVPPVLKPPPPPVPSKTPEPPAPVEPVRPAPRAHAVRATPGPVRPAEPPPPTATATATEAGGEQVVHMDDVAPSATGVGVAVGRPATGRVGRGGTGGGTGGGDGAGSGELARPVSVATIKTGARAKGDYGYFDAGKDYPAEARMRGIEGKIRVRLVVDKHGKVTSRVLLNRLGYGLDEWAMKRAGEMEFEPAIDSDDHPVTSVVVWTFTMTLPK